MGFGKTRITGSAFPALNTALTEVTKSFAVLMLALYARHIGLVFLARQADNEFASALRLTPRAEQPRRPVRAGHGAFNCWGDCSVLSEFPRSQGACSLVAKP
jgi:hypothetical protein